jgi:hypothetical protein
MAALVELTSVPVANDDSALPDDIPERPVTTGALHEYVVPTGTISALPEPPLFDGITEDVDPEQIAERVMAAIVGFGSTVTVVLNVEPIHEPEVGVTV